MRYILLFSLLIGTFCATAQDADAIFAAEIELHRQHYKAEFITEERSPLDAADTSFLDFFPADRSWKVTAGFNATPDAQIFDMPTYSGRSARYVQYGTLDFEKNGAVFQLNIYQNVRLLQMPEYKDYLFLPFKDPSNGGDTYGGGRYLELRAGDIFESEGKRFLELDFNKCFNPYCAYSDGYNCPVPPRENDLPISVTAGEKNFRGEKKH